MSIFNKRSLAAIMSRFNAQAFRGRRVYLLSGEFIYLCFAALLQEKEVFLTRKGRSLKKLGVIYGQCINFEAIKAKYFLRRKIFALGVIEVVC